MTEYRILWIPTLGLWRVYHVGWRLSPAYNCDFPSLESAIAHYSAYPIRVG